MGWFDDFYESFFQDERRYCPRCHEKFYPGECDIVATFPPHTKGELLLKGKKGPQARKNPRTISGDYMKRLATRQCPSCDYYLPRNIDTTPLLNIAVVGDYQSGKSHYIASLIKQLREERVVPDDEYFRLIGMTPLVEDKYEQEYLGKLFGSSPEILPRTTPLLLGDTIDPLIYELTYRRSIDYRPRTVNLAIHDAAGEDYKSPEKIVEFTQHVIHASGLIYLANPAAFPEIERTLSPDIKRPPHRSPAITLNTIVKLIEEFRGLPAGSRLADLPLAITLSKSDLLKKGRPTSNPFSFSKNPLYRGGADLLDLAKVEHDVLDVLNHSGDRALIPATQTIEKRRFLAISATGRPPDQSGSYAAVEPCRCLDPFLWILHELGLIPPTGQP